MDNISVSFVKGSLLTDLDASVDVSLDMITEMYEQSGYTISATKPVDVKLGDKDFKKVVLKEEIAGVGITQYVYFAMFNNYLVNISCTSADYSGMTDTEFEQMIS